MTFTTVAFIYPPNEIFIGKNPQYFRQLNSWQTSTGFVENLKATEEAAGRENRPSFSPRT